MAIRNLLLVLAMLSFILEVCGVKVLKVNLVPLGLAFLAAAFLL